MRKIVLMMLAVGAACLGAPAAAVGQTSDELIYSVNRTPEPLFDASRGASVITIDEVWRKNARTLSELLVDEVGIFLRQTNYGGGSPIIRGLIGKHILILVDGAKINTSTYEFGPVDFLNTIDINTVERVEIVRGVGSVLSSAMGGIINVITKKGPGPGEVVPVGGSAFTRYSTADQSMTGHLEMFGRTERTRFLAGVTYRETDDVKAGSGIGLQRDVGYDEIAANVTVEHRVSAFGTLSGAYRLMNQADVPGRVLTLAGQPFAFNIDSRRLQQGMLRYQDLPEGGLLDFLQVTAHWNRQDDDQGQHFPPQNIFAPQFELRSDDHQTSYEVNVELGSFIGNAHRLLYGVDVETERVVSIGQVVVGDSMSFPSNGRYPDGATYRTFAAYLQDRMTFGRIATLTVGARFNQVWIRGDRDVSTLPGFEDSGLINVDKNASDVTGLANLTIHAGDHLNVIANVARGFRSPDIEDVGVLNAQSYGVQVPNVDINPERIQSYEAGVKFSSARISGAAFYFYNDLDDLLQPAPGTLFGEASFDVSGLGFVSPTGGLIPFLQRQNLGQASIQGVELEAQLRPHDDVTFHGTFTYTRGDDDVNDVPFAGIPPAYGSASIQWSTPAEGRPWIQVGSEFAAAQTRLHPMELLDDNMGTDGTDGFVTFNARGGMTLLRSLRLNIGVDNITNQAFRYHGSGVFRPGFQAVFGLEYKLDHLTRGGN